MDTKMCGTCGELKDSSKFYKRAASGDGLAACCKDCQRVYDIARRDDPDRKAYREAMRPKYAHKQTEYNTSWRKRNPEKYKAHIILNNAVRDGKIIKGACEECQSPEVEAHHDDYTKPLEVRWLCPKHHGITRRIDGDVHESA
jgi:hypothetical protein